MGVARSQMGLKSRVRYLSYVTFGKFPGLSEPLLPLL